MHQQFMKQLILCKDSLNGGTLQNHGNGWPSTASGYSFIQGTLWVAELRSICQKLELNWCFL